MKAEQIYREALAFTLRWEGGYVNHPNDPGGATNFGVTQAVYNRYRRSNGLRARSVRWIKTFEVEQIYRADYWEAAQCDRMPPLIAFCHFDWTVNTGRGRSIRHLQGVVGAKADGVWGPRSQAALLSAVEERGQLQVAEDYLDRRKRYYEWLGAKPRFSVFRTGWMRRLNSLRAEILILKRRVAS